MILQNPNLQTIVPTLFRPSPNLDFRRETIITTDHDFIDLDWAYSNGSSKKLAVLVHGLEGSSKSFYMTNAMKQLHGIGCDTAGMNLRSCSGRMNNLLKTYHSGKTEDLALIINHILKNYSYETIYLIGFSVGANIVLKYLGEVAGQIDSRIKKSMTFSAPIDLKSVANALARPQGRLYMSYFLLKLHDKIKAKMKQFPGQISDEPFAYIKTFHEYDDCYTAPLNNFKNADDYWDRASSRSLLSDITIPTMLLSAADDPLLGPGCYPYELKNPNFLLKVTDYGGHMGFWRFNHGLEFFHEKIMIEFLNN